jgi:hypothetical protein
MTKRTGSKKDAQQRGRKSTDAASLARSRSPASDADSMQSEVSSGNQQSATPSRPAGKTVKQRGNR